MKTARQIAASKRNIAKAQAASARARKGKHRSSVSQHTYGTGRAGRKNTRRALYGSRRHGISPVQYQRRQQRANKWKRRAGYAATAVALGVGVWSQASPAQKAHVKAAAKSGLNTVKTKYKYHTGIGRQIRKSKRSK